MQEINFVINDSIDGGFEAEAGSFKIYKGCRFEIFKNNIKDAVFFILMVK